MSSHLVQRLTEARRAPVVGTQPLPVVIAHRPVTFWQCPHCHQEIHEKHLFYENEVAHHSDCGGAVELPEMDWSEVSPEWRALLEPKA